MVAARRVGRRSEERFRVQFAGDCIYEADHGGGAGDAAEHTQPACPVAWGRELERSTGGARRAVAIGSGTVARGGKAFHNFMRLHCDVTRHPEAAAPLIRHRAGR